MKILTLHCDYIRFKPLKKALKSAEELSLKDKEEKNVKDPLVILTAVEKGDNDQTLKEMIEAIEHTAKEVKAKALVLYPYAHLSSNLTDPQTALEYLVEAEHTLKKKGFEVIRAPFGYYKTFEIKVKGHPLSELSKQFGIKDAEDVKGSHRIIEVSEKEYDVSRLLNELSRSKLDTSKLKENDHRILGQKLDLFSFNEAAPGSVFWHNNGLVIYNELVKYWRNVHDKTDYKEISTPQILDNKLWKVSGHWRLYKDNMFLTEYEGRDSGVKPMNCPGAMLIFKSRTRSYKDLPLRFSELGVVHRKELSGVLAGIFRTIKFTQDDAHIFCAQEHLESEILNVIKLFKEILDKFSFEYRFTISIRSKEKKEKYLGDDKVWKIAEDALVNGLKKLKLKYTLEEGEAKFYGPSLDIQIKDSLEREWQCSTLQLDFNLPSRFELEYTDKDNKLKTPIVLHRVVYGSLERFIGVLLEHLNGNLPLWLSPIQVRVTDFTDRNTKEAEKILKELKEKIPNLRIDSDFSSTTVSDKIRDASLMKIPYILVVGDKEEQNKTLAIRTRDGKVKYGVKIDYFVSELKDKIEKRL